MVTIFQSTLVDFVAVARFVYLVPLGTSVRVKLIAKIVFLCEDFIDFGDLGKATPSDDFYGKDGIFSRLFSKTIEQMLEAELSAEHGRCSATRGEIGPVVGATL